MSYDDLQNQQFYMQQRMQSQPQGMSMPIAQQNQTPMSLQQQPLRHQAYGMMPQAHQQLVMRMPTLSEDQVGQYQQQQFRDYIQSLPPNVQNQINTERDPERRRQILQNIKHQHQIYEQQMGIRNTITLPSQRMPVPQAQGMIYANGGQQMVQQQPTSTPIQRVSTQASFGQTSGQPQQISQMYMSNQMGQIKQPMQPMPITQSYVQQHFQQQSQIIQQQHPQLMNKQSVPTNNISAAIQQRNMTSEIPLGSMATTQIRKTQSTQIIQQLSGNHLPITEENLKSENASEQQPRSAETAHLLSAQQHNETENPDYKLLLEQLRTYHTDVKRLLDRMILDNVEKEAKLRSSLINVIQVMEGTRKGPTVTRDLLRKLLANVQTVLCNKNIAKNLYNAAGNLSKIPVRDYPAITRKESSFDDSWKNVRHLQIRVPECVNELIEKNKLGRQETILRKRHKTENSINEEQQPVKRSLPTGI